MKRVLVTGAGGFVGAACLEALARSDFEVHAVARAPRAAENVVWHAADLLMPGAARELIRAVRPTHLLGLAWCAEPGSYWESAENAAWLRAGLELIEGFDGERAVFAGSCAEYDWRYGLCSEGLTPLQPATFYGRCKRLLFESLSAIGERRKLSWAWGRLFFIYGQRERKERLVPAVIRALSAGEPFPCSDGRQVRDFLHVDDAAAVLVRLLDSDYSGAINIASGAPVAVRTLVQSLGEKLNGAQLLQFGALAKKEEPYLIADVRTLFDRLGWRPSLTLDQGLDRAIDWWRANS
jgi:nucleoside-diphosphate-sugar epimerase